MKEPRAVWITVHKGDIDLYTSIEILWQTDTNTLHLLMFRLSPDADRLKLTVEETGPYTDLVELCQQIGVLFGEILARRICRNPNSWLPQEQLELLAGAAYDCQDGTDFDKRPEIPIQSACCACASGSGHSDGNGGLKKLHQEASARLRRADCAVVEGYQTSRPEKENLPATIN